MKKTFPRCRCSARLIVLFSLPFWTVSPVSAGERPAPELVWELRADIDAPESAYYDPGSDVIFISNVGGVGSKKDGEGWIHKVRPNGKVLESRWVSGLNAPKGMRAHDGVLYVTDIDRVLGFDIKTGKTVREIKIAKAKFLNDIAVGPKGELYVSDTLQSLVYVISPKGRVKVFVEGEVLESPNGLFVARQRLYIASWGLTTDWSTKTQGRLLSVGLKKKKIHSMSGSIGNLDGLERMGSDWLTSDWVAGKVFRVSKGVTEVLLEGLEGSADIGYIEHLGLLIVPQMKGNVVSAYRLDTGGF